MRCNKRYCRPAVDAHQQAVDRTYGEPDVIAAHDYGLSRLAIGYHIDRDAVGHEYDSVTPGMVIARAGADNNSVVPPARQRIGMMPHIDDGRFFLRGRRYRGVCRAAVEREHKQHDRAESKDQKHHGQRTPPQPHSMMDRYG